MLLLCSAARRSSEYSVQVLCVDTEQARTAHMFHSIDVLAPMNRIGRQRLQNTWAACFPVGCNKIHQTSEKHMAWTYTCKQGVRFGSQAVFARACFFRAGEEVLQAPNWRIGRGLHSDLPPSVRFENIVALLLPGPSPFIIHGLFVYLDDQCW